MNIEPYVWNGASGFCDCCEKLIKTGQAYIWFSKRAGPPGAPSATFNIHVDCLEKIIEDSPITTCIPADASKLREHYADIYRAEQEETLNKFTENATLAS